MHSAMAAVRVILAGAFAQNKTRGILSVLAIALGVALGYAVQLITQSAQNELALGVRTLSGDADLQVRGPRSGFDESLYPELSRLPEVAVASPVVEIDAKLADREDVLKIVGVDALRAAEIQPGLIAEAGDRLDLFRPDLLFLSPAAARWLGLSAGGALSFQVALRDATLTVAGLARAGEQQRFAVMDIAGAQSNFDRLGSITRIDLRLKPGVDLAAFRDRLQQRLPAGIAVERPEASLAASASVSRSYRVNLNVLALVALFTGGLLVFSTQALAVVRRRAQFALLRVLGVTRRRLVAALLAEGALIGAAGRALALIPLPRDAASRLALLQLRGAPGQAAVSLAAIVASMSLMISMAIMVTSFRDALDVWLERILPADVYVRAAAAGDTSYMTSEDQTRIAALPGVRRAEFVREQQLLLDPSRPRVVLLARDIDPADPGRRLALVGAPARPPAEAPPMWVNEAMVDLYGFTAGKVVAIPIAGKPTAFAVAGVWRDYARPQGAVVIERERYVALTGDRTATNGALWLAPGTDLDQVSHAIAREVPGGGKLDVAAPGEVRDASLRIFDRTFAVTYALELAAVVIGLTGLSSSFGALVLARRREFGVLRHLGMTRRQIAAMLATEALTVSGIGLAIGLGLGSAISLILIHVVNRQSFHWGMGVSVPWATLAAAALVVLALSTLTAWASGRKAMSDDV